jgi:phosphate transport system substrate-binding protein
MMKKWASAYVKDRGVEVNYTSTGSTNGVSSMTEGEKDFGCTDAPMSEEQMNTARSKGGEVFHLPLLMGGVVPLYNLEGIDQPLKFDGPVLADIFLGKIKKWNDPRLKQLNEGVNLPDLEVLPVHRSDGSGTTYIFTDYLSKVSDEWRKGPGHGTVVKWPEGTVAQPKNDGVAGQVKRTKGAIGYVELIYALESKLNYGSVKNREGEFITASLESVTVAASNALKDPPEDLRFSITDAPGKGAYPISGTVWAVVYQHQKNSDKAKALADFFAWATHEGQQFTDELHYARLPNELAERVNKKLEGVRTGVK